MGTEKIKNICNVGTGTMGFATALMFAMGGYGVKMYGRSEQSVRRGVQNIEAALETYRRHDLMTAETVREILARIKGVTTLEEAAEGADFVIESVAEELAVKREVFNKLDKLCPPYAIFASNTSGLSPTAIAEAVVRKDKFVVAHFWNPPHLVPLVEIIPGKDTSQDTVETTWNLMTRIGKEPVALKREALGFIGNRLQLALLREALYIVESGIATQEAVDSAIKYSLGRRLGITGIFESADLGGLDIFYNLSSYLLQDLSNSTEVSPLLKEAMVKGTLGAKTGLGFYSWTPEALSKIKKMREDTLIEWIRKDRQASCATT